MYVLGGMLAAEFVAKLMDSHSTAGHVFAGVGLVFFGIGHLTRREGLYRHSLRATRVWGLLFIAQGAWVLWVAVPAHPATVGVGLGEFAVFDVIGEALFWRWSHSGVIKTLQMLRTSPRTPSQA
jgi:multisubunit Na+/H+ antiporter MnhB subunit